ncbi:MAG: hypothetical protein M0Z89_01440 [Nitrospiraceae bacterium]|nr:hypothetical protein [Nitrospiraceae bacterium]
MLKKLGIIIAVLILAVSFGACKKKEATPQLPPGHPGMENGMPGTPKVERTVVVPKDVKAKWKAVKIAITDKATKGSKEYTIAVGSDLAIPKTKVKIKVLAFLPDFRMTDKEITSATDKPNNPAVQVVIQEPGKPEWKGWLYSMHPDVHPFEHEKIAILLVGGVAK